MKNLMVSLLMLISYEISFSQTYFEKGNEAYNNGEYDTAIKYYSLSIKNDSTNFSFYNLRGNAYFSKRDYKMAIIDYSKAISLKPNDNILFLNRGGAYLSLEDYENANIDFTKAIQLDPEYCESYIKRGDLYRTRGTRVLFDFDKNKKIQNVARKDIKPDYMLAIKDYTSAIQKEPNNLIAYYNRGESYYKINEYDKAIKDFSKVLELKNDYLEVYLSRADAFKKINDFEKAKNDYSFVIDLEPSNYSYYKSRAYCYKQMGVVDLAINDYSNAINYFIIDKDYQKYLEKIDKNKDEDWVNSLFEELFLSSYYEERGKLYYFLKEYQNAINDFSNSIKFGDDKSSVSNYINRGKTYLKIGNQNLAIADFNSALSIDNYMSPQSAISYYYLNRTNEANQLIADLHYKGYDSIKRLNNYKFDMSRASSLLNNKQFALNNLVEAIELGYSNLSNILFEDDFENIKRTKEFSEILTKKGINVPDYLPETDENIPITQKTNPFLYALIVGNEDYTNFQQGISSEVNVKYAENDAKIFKEYVIKTLGAPERNTCILLNTTMARLMQEIDKLSSFAEVQNGKAEIIFYYAGHGLASNDTREPYLIPVDVDGSNLKYAIKLQDIIDKLSLHSTKRTTIFIDACFSGGARGEELISMRAVKVRPKDNLAKGNMVVFASSSEEQSSQSYDEMKHGLFTYFLLKKIKESKGDVNYGELFNYLKEQVSVESLYNKSQKQTPSLTISIEAVNKWENWKLLE